MWYIYNIHCNCGYTGIILGKKPVPLPRCPRCQNEIKGIIGLERPDSEDLNQLKQLI